MDIDLSTLCPPWVAIGGDGEGFVSELRREITRGHVLFSRKDVQAIARREDRDDVLFVVDDMLAVVHLTYSPSEADPRWPHTELYGSWHEFLSERMNVDATEFDAGAV